VAAKRLIEWHGITLGIAEWARKLGILPATMSARLLSMPVEKAFTMPTQACGGSVKRIEPSPMFGEYTAEEAALYGLVDADEYLALYERQSRNRK